MLLRPSEFDARAFAVRLEAEVLPGILDGITDAIAREPRMTEKLQAATVIHREIRDEPEVHARALLAAAAPFAPPAGLEGGSETHALLLGMIAFRAATTEFIQRYPDSQARHRRAAGWVC